MKTYKVTVEEVHICTREYFINAESKSEASKRAKNFDYDDANEGTWSGTDKIKIVSTEESKTDLTE